MNIIVGRFPIDYLEANKLPSFFGWVAPITANAFITFMGLDILYTSILLNDFYKGIVSDYANSKKNWRTFLIHYPILFSLGSIYHFSIRLPTRWANFFTGNKGWWSYEVPGINPPLPNYPKIMNDRLFKKIPVYMNGTWEELDENNEVRRKYTFKKGKLEGPYEEYYLDGSPKLKMAFSKDEPSGLQQEWWPSGGIKREIDWNPFFHPKFKKDYFLNGNIEWEKTFYDDASVDTSIIYWDNGNKREETKYNKGKDPNSRMQTIVYVKNWKEDGTPSEEFE